MKLSYKGREVTYEQLEKIIEEGFVDEVVDKLIEDRQQETNNK